GVGTAGDSQASSRIWKERAQQAQPLLEKGTSPLPSLAGLVKKLKPAVVNVYTTQVIRPRVRRYHRRMPGYGDPFGFFEDPFDFFDRFFQVPQREYRRSSLGSGFIISPDGYVLTNNHVIANATEIKVKLIDERVFDAKVIGSDPKTDVALLKLKKAKGLPFAYLGDSDKLEVGDWVVAIGNPFGLGHTVTVGIISAKDRQIGHGPYDDFLQTDAAINPGNSGGPLFDTAGNVVGINTAIIAQGSGIGFAVPINLAKQLIPQLKEHGKVTRGWLGVGIQELTADLAENFGVKPKEGVLVSQVFEDSPADRAGLKAGDIILELNGRKMRTVRQLTATVASLAPGTRVKIKVLRDGKQLTFAATLGEREQGEALAMGEAPADGDTESLGMRLRPLTPEIARRLGVDERLKGLVVEEIEPDSPAAGMVREGDIILEVNRKRVTSVADLRKALKRGGNRLLLRIQRGTAQLFLVISK
ncbi:MAG: DegQ family serine endoprotease, partial [Deltaproteobacteria bacterium]